MKDDAYIQHMIDAISKIEEYTRNISYKDFEKDELRQDAVTRQMEILGEAAKRVSEDTKNKNPEIPFGKMPLV